MIKVGVLLSVLHFSASAEERTVHVLWTGNPGPSAYLQQHGLLESEFRAGKGEVLSIRMGSAWTNGKTVVYDSLQFAEEADFAEVDCRIERPGTSYDTPQDISWSSEEQERLQGRMDLLSATTAHWVLDNGKYNSLERRSIRSGFGRVWSGGAAVGRCVLLDGGVSDSWRREKLLTYRVKREGREGKVFFMTKTYGGIDRVAAAIRAFKAKYPDGIVLSRGNTFGAIPDAALPKEQAAAFLEGLGFDAVGVGGWEIRQYRWAKMSAARPKMPAFVSANVHHDEGDAAYFEAHTVLERNGIRIGVIGATNPMVRDKYAMFKEEATHVTDNPHFSVRRSVRALHGLTDATILLSNLYNLKNADAIAKAPGVDLVLGDHEEATSQRRSTSIDVRGRDREAHKGPVLVSRIASRKGVTRLDLTFRREGTSDPWSLGRVVETPMVLGPGSPRDPEFRKVFDAHRDWLLSDTRVLIKDPRRLFGGERSGEARLRFSEEEFWTLGAEAMRSKADAEVGVVNVRNHENDTVGAVTAGFVREWVQGEDELLVSYVDGKRLRSILASWRERKKGLSDAGGEAIRLAVSGASASGEVRGFPVRDGDSYRLAYSSYFLDHPAEFPEFSDLKPVRGQVPVPLSDVILEWLEASPADETVARALKGNPKREGPLWRVDFRQIGFSLTETRVSRKNRFSQVRDARVRADESEQIAGEAHIHSELLLPRVKFGADARLALSRLRIKTAGGETVVNEPIDTADFGLESTYSFASFPWIWLGSRWGPSLGFRYETELTPVDGLPVKRIYKGTVGPEIFGGSLFQKTQLGALFQLDQSRTDPKTQTGVYLGSFARKGIAAGTLESDLTAQYLFRTDTDEASDLFWELNWKLRVKMPLWRHLRINPFLDLFVFRAKSSRDVGKSAIFGFEVGFSRLWKPLEEPFWR